MIMLSSTVWDWIIVRINIGVQPINGFASEVGSATRRNKSAPFGAVISGVAVVEASIIDRAIATEAKMGTFECTILTFLFYHFSSPQSRKSLPGDPGRLGITIRRNSKECLLLSFPIFPKGLKLGFAVTRQGEHKWQPTHTNKLIKQVRRIVQ